MRELIQKQIILYFVVYYNIHRKVYIFYIYIYIYLIIIISDSVDDRDQKPRYRIEVLLNLSRYLLLVMRELIQKQIILYFVVYYNIHRKVYI